MPSKKRPGPGAPTGTEPPWHVILEEMRSQNRATIGAVESSRATLEQRLERLDQETRARDATLELAVRQLRTDLRRVEGKVEDMGVLEERVAALERRS